MNYLRKALKFITFLLIIGIVFSCSSDKEESANSYYNQIIKTDKGIIRGVNLNDNIKQIKKKEKKKAIIAETAAIIEYEYPLEQGGTYVVAYSFDNNGCYEIDVDTYFETVAPAQEVLATMKAYFDEKFGEAEQDEGLYIWKNKNKTTTVELDYINQEEGEIMLTIFANE